MTYSNLTIWQKAMDLVEKIYLLSNNLPSSEKFGLASQIQRAAVSIPSNIAEGYGRKSKLEYSRFLDIARGSLYELETQIHIGIMLEFFTNENTERAFSLSQEVGKMLNSLITKLEN